mgnify:CR=1 FL=1
MKIAIKDLKHDPKAIRKVKANNLDSLIASIKSQNMLHNLVVAKNGTGYVVIDGNRRLSALHNIHGKDSAELVECIEIDEPSEEVGLHANMMREGMHPLDEADVIHKLCAGGDEDFDSIAKRFGQTSKWVEQRSALSELSPTVAKAFRNMEMNFGIASLFTNVDKARQDEIMKTIGKNRIDYDEVKHAVFNTKLMKDQIIIPKSHRLYKEIQWTGDLFSNRQYASDTDKAIALQEQYVSEKIEWNKKRYKDVILFKDTNIYESPQTIKNLTKEFNKDEYSMSDMTLTVHFFPLRGQFYVQQWVDKRDMNKKEIESIKNGETTELTLADMSNPQHEMVMDKYWHVHRRHLASMNDVDSDINLALMCSAAFSYVSYTDITFKDKSVFKEDEEPSFYKNDIVDELLKQYNDVIIDKMKDQVTQHNVFKTFRSMGTKFMTRYLWISNIASMSRESCIAFAQEQTNIKPEVDWFKADPNWIKKYKTSQLFMLCDKLKIHYTNLDKKNDLVTKIYEAFKKGLKFDPIKMLKDLK